MVKGKISCNQGDDELTIRTELVGGVGKYGRLLGWLYIGDSETSLNELMISEGYAWSYDGGTKKKDFEELREIRRSWHVTIMAPPKKKRTIGWHLQKRLDEVAKWHKKEIRNIRKKYNLTDYKLLWIAFGKGFIIGAILL